MKKIIYILLLSLSVFSCKNSDLESSNQFEDSFNKFKEFRKESNNSYQYQTNSSFMTEMSRTTTITVINGKVVKREYLVKIFNGFVPKSEEGWTDQEIEAIYAKQDDFFKKYLIAKNITLKEYLGWSESEKELGKYNDLGATPIMTLDEVYSKAKGEWLVTQEKKKIFFETNNNGMISSCGYIMGNCQDGCFTGINISYIKALKIEGNPNFRLFH